MWKEFFSRETGEYYSNGVEKIIRENDGIGFWIYIDKDENILDRDQYRHDLFERNNIKVTK